MKPILYYAKDCPDTKPFVDKLYPIIRDACKKGKVTIEIL